MARRVLHGSAWYPPQHWGGTEVYLTGLVRDLRDFGVDSRIAAPLMPSGSDGYEFDGTVVRTYSVNDTPSRAELRGEHKPDGFERFVRILNEERPDIYHQHSWTRGMGGAHLNAARKAGLKTVLTMHTPNGVCPRGTMMRFGEVQCDGHLGESKCAPCWAQSRGAIKPFAYGLASMPSFFGNTLRAMGGDGQIAGALSARANITRFRDGFRQMADDADRIVAVCQWLYDAMLVNGVPKEKLLLSRQGVDREFLQHVGDKAEPAQTGKLRILYIGRWHAAKGIHILVDAVQMLPKDALVELVIHSALRDAEERAYAQRVEARIKDDNRIRIEPFVPRNRLPQVLTQADVLAVPSLWLETGPIVVLEAKACGLPILGSRTGGIAELVEEPADGVLIEPGNARAWASAISTFMNTAGPRSRAPKTVRTMRDVAVDMSSLYASLLQ